MICNLINAQVGIKNPNPKETLDVIGDISTKKLYLRDPGSPTETGGDFLGGSSNTLDRLDPTKTPMAIFNYIKLSLVNVSPTQGVRDFDTKIDANKFILVVHNFSVDSYTKTAIPTFSSAAVDYNNDGINNNAQGSPVFQSFVSGGTWHVRGYFDNSAFKPLDTSSGQPPENTYNINLYMVAYYNSVTKNNITDKAVNLSGTDGSGPSYSIPKPTGF